MKVPLFLILCASFYHSVVTLKCYTCSVGEQDTDMTCIDTPEKTTPTNCNKKYCTTKRQELLEPQGKVVSMFRGCEDTPEHMNEIVEDATYRWYFVACKEDLCNGGSGKASDDNNSGSLGDKSTILVPGTGKNGSKSIQTSFVVIATLFIVNLVISNL
ncbi:hypothetical protein TcasGA2_TC034604 [Tribolium castaneum]|uniref:Protein quiver n=1 Tax=Tribolium castaneum TaxID=7070 RepID=A0A139WKZ1_TRICA|nr:PREDICTED: uncharacterized protein LOC103312404 [Tribolium castaneum]KYB28554.1 hypothetical protein TcasGA2_TC034604 [Tribolium castaneum]|eukprot:XP_008191165.1 PREDICTED: uncharacterized protein LOC103312404 [Tribolium castaneum]